MSNLFAEPFSRIQSALIDVLGDAGIDCYDYPPVELRKADAAYLSVTDVYATRGGRHDQGDARIGSVRYEISHFVRLDGDPRKAYARAYADADKIMQALSSATLGGRVADCRLDDRIGIDPVNVGREQRPAIMVQAVVIVSPGAYTRL